MLSLSTRRHLKKPVATIDWTGLEIHNYGQRRQKSDVLRESASVFVAERCNANLSNPTAKSHHKRSLLLTAGALAQRSALDEVTVEDTRTVPLHVNTAKSLPTG